MNTTVVIHQPDFIPYLGFFHRFLSADLYVVLDHVQFVYGSRAWTHRDKIKTPRGPQWLTVSVDKPRRDTAINQVRLSDQVDWRTDHIRLLEANYRDAEFFPEIMPHMRLLYAESATMLADFNLKSIGLLMSLLDVERPMVFSSTLQAEGAKTDLMVDLMRKVGGTKYLTGSGSRDYLKEEVFEAAGIEVVWQDFHHPVYPQQYGDFLPFLSTVDMLFNCGIDKSRQLLRGEK